MRTRGQCCGGAENVFNCAKHVRHDEKRKHVGNNHCLGEQVWHGRHSAPNAALLPQNKQVELELENSWEQCFDKLLTTTFLFDKHGFYVQQERILKIVEHDYEETGTESLVVGDVDVSGVVICVGWDCLQQCWTMQRYMAIVFVCMNVRVSDVRRNVTAVR